MIGEGAAHQLKLVPPFNDTLFRRIGDKANDIHDQLIDQVARIRYAIRWGN